MSSLGSYIFKVTSPTKLVINIKTQTNWSIALYFTIDGTRWRKSRR